MPTIKYKKEGKIAIFTLNRPDVLNAQNVQLHHELNDAFLDFRDDSDLWVGIINGHSQASRKAIHSSQIGESAGTSRPASSSPKVISSFSISTICPVGSIYFSGLFKQ